MKIEPIPSNREPSSFRDPSGFIFFHEGKLLRQINRVYQKDFEQLLQSGLYEKLVNDGLLISHQIVGEPAPKPSVVFRVIEPERIPFISYPYEWTFSQLKSAALLTLRIQSLALQHAMTLKDCSAYNVQFIGVEPIFIDTLSFERYQDGQPWIAYRQFCQHFLGPLLLARYNDTRLVKLLQTHLDGIPLDLISRLLPKRSWLLLTPLLHLHMHALSQKHYGRTGKRPRPNLSQKSQLALLDNLESFIRRCQPSLQDSTWSNYYNQSNYSATGFAEKKKVVAQILNQITAKNVCDFGGNQGIFSRIAAENGAYTVSVDSDAAAVEQNFVTCPPALRRQLLPLVIDITNPSPALGWRHEERKSFLDRLNCDTALALAIIHHLTIAGNLSFLSMADFFANVCNHLIIEFIPAHDSNAQRLLAAQPHAAAGYNVKAFEAAFLTRFNIIQRHQISDNTRSLYVMKHR